MILFSDESSTSVKEVSQRLAEVEDDDYAEMDVSKQTTTDAVVEAAAAVPPEAAAPAAAQLQPADSRHSSSRVRLIFLEYGINMRRVMQCFRTRIFGICMWKLSF